MPSLIRTTSSSSKIDTSTRAVWLLTLNCLVACALPADGVSALAPDAVEAVDTVGIVLVAARTEAPPGASGLDP